ncbi:hypothetical protein V495_06953 [Pseudogymnoascus sp. VKM F-4514 (FW-929)]|nr:hypothetical protein V495_06953 [Pseudogymnoascus sp. VKM F-4514 (FW-929)]KFY54780.1 hypothetical protein V497_07438 [Pseudogymnoascus sp. VKM F-4516 (FW-969)]
MPTAKYYPVSLADEKESYSPSDTSSTTLLPEEQDLRVTERRHLKSVLQSKWLLVAHALFFLFSLAIFLRGITFAAPTTAKFVKQFSEYSPAAHVIEYEDIKFNGSMYATSPYIGKGPEVDAAWNVISYNVGDQMISAAELRKIDKPNTVLKVTDPRTGIEGYRVGLEVFHQLHCLNLLRQTTHIEYYGSRGGDFAEGIDGLRMHLDHCLEMLRMNLMCQSDVGLITFETTDEGIWPDFSTWHTCRKFDNVLEWAMENTVANDDPM